MEELRQKELVTGQQWFPHGDEIPNVATKLFALQNLCTDCKICEVACSLIHSPNSIPPWRGSRLSICHR